MQDQILDWAVVVCPTLLSVVGVFVTLEPLDKRHRNKWRVGLLVFGVAISSLTYIQQRHQRDTSEREARLAREQFSQLANNNATQFKSVKERLEEIIKHPQSQQQRDAATKIKNELRAGNDPLAEFDDEKLVDWGKPLLDTLDGIATQYTNTIASEAKHGKIDSNKADNAAWLEAVLYKNCCAETVLKYNKSLSWRVYGGMEDRELNEWTQDLLKPDDSPEHKSALTNAPLQISSAANNLRVLWGLLRQKTQAHH